MGSFGLGQFFVGFMSKGVDLRVDFFLASWLVPTGSLTGPNLVHHRPEPVRRHRRLLHGLQDYTNLPGR
jgi:hypothetical protein